MSTELIWHLHNWAESEAGPVEVIQPDQVSYAEEFFFNASAKRAHEFIDENPEGIFIVIKKGSVS